MSSIFKHCQQASRVLLVFTVVTGLVYPLFVTGLGQLLCPWRANGSIRLGSQWIGQPFTANDYFWGRPSATLPEPYNGLASMGSNMSMSSSAYLVHLQERVDRFQPNIAPIPVELVTASGSGLDPDISPAAAIYQAERIAQARHLPVSHIMMLIQKHIIPRTWSILGEPRINVLALNKALDAEGE